MSDNTHSGCGALFLLTARGLRRELVERTNSGKKHYMGIGRFRSILTFAVACIDGTPTNLEQHDTSSLFGSGDSQWEAIAGEVCSRRVRGQRHDDRRADSGLTKVVHTISLTIPKDHRPPPAGEFGSASTVRERMVARRSSRRTSTRSPTRRSSRSRRSSKRRRRRHVVIARGGLAASPRHAIPLQSPRQNAPAAPGRPGASAASIRAKNQNQLASQSFPGFGVSGRERPTSAHRG